MYTVSRRPTSPQYSKCRSPLANEINVIKMAGMPKARNVPNCASNGDWVWEGKEVGKGSWWSKLERANERRKNEGKAAAMPTLCDHAICKGPKSWFHSAAMEVRLGSIACWVFAFWAATSSLIVWGTRGADISSGAYWLIGVVCGEMCTSQNA